MKYLFVACATLLIIGCSSHNEHYYQIHPQALQDAIKSCPAKQPTPLSCEQLTSLAVAMNEIAYQLQTNPQAFGRKILALQQAMASQEAALKTKADPELKATLEKNKLLLEQYLAVVRWLESPES
ncbi:hypothetical protein BN59_02495 [Legionella massiliensis]|uniref:Secreted endonuclease n=2 Tax=Legionella massiliensis TaxID=1034943 RepID=A0A078KYN8_9GAMM|nr:hypothetical protein BN59_02495 [Legionella massiliensis]CEE13925.1 hypothetical protein BN1094_02495 [Legionella massiliensis]